MRIEEKGRTGCGLSQCWKLRAVHVLPIPIMVTTVDAMIVVVAMVAITVIATVVAVIVVVAVVAIIVIVAVVVIRITSMMSAVDTSNAPGC